MVEDLGAYLASELTAHFGLSARDAQALADTAASRAARSRGEYAGDEASKLLALCRVTAHFAWIRDLWDTETGQRLRQRLGTLGGLDTAWVTLNELASSPAPDELDINWPDSKLFRAVTLPQGARAGDRFVVGGGDGWRCVMRVEDHNGELGAVIHRMLNEPLASFYWQASSEIRRHTAATD